MVALNKLLSVLSMFQCGAFKYVLVTFTSLNKT